jgi:hypothetical protein
MVSIVEDGVKGRCYVLVTFVWMILCHYAAVGQLYFHPSDEWSDFDSLFAWTGGIVSVLYLPVAAVLIVIAAVTLWTNRKSESSGMIRLHIVAGLAFLALTFLAFWAITLAAENVKHSETASVFN